MITHYLVSVFRHKWFVFCECVRLGIPFLGIIHDFSKFGLREMLPYARHFYSDESQNEHDHGSDFDVAWNAHQKRNKHHWQYWVLINDRSEPQITALSMPERYIREMVADWRGAGRAYGNTDTVAWYRENASKQLMHPDTRRRVEELLGIA